MVRAFLEWLLELRAAVLTALEHYLPWEYER